MERFQKIWAFIPEKLKNAWNDWNYKKAGNNEMEI